MFDDDFSYTDRGTRVQLATSLRLGGDFSPRRLSTKGRSYRFLTVDADVRVDRDSARVVFLGDSSAVGLPSRFFAIQGYAPLAAQALLVRYWERHGRPRELATVPGNPVNRVRIEFRGVDTLRTAGRSVVLRRYAVDGVAWGREALWLDGRGRLAALVTRANVLPLEGVREELAPLLPQLQSIAIRDRMRDLARLQRDVAPVAGGHFALVGARVIDATGASPVDDATIVVRDGRIVAFGPSAVTPVPRGARAIDARGTTIVPGLWDMHAHAGQIEWGPAYLAAGVTTARDMGGESEFLTAFRDAVDGGTGLGPRLLLAGLVDGPGDGAFGTVTAATPDEGRAVVDRYHARGFRQIKLYTLLAPAVVGAVTRRAHSLGMRVTGHVPRALTLEQALDSGMDHVAHLPVRGEAGDSAVRTTIAALVRHRSVVDPTLSWNELLGRSKATPISQFQPGYTDAPWPLVAAYGSVRNDDTPSDVAARMRASLTALEAMHDAGVRIVAGTDYGLPGHSLHRELELYVMAGLSPLEAIQSATAVPASVMGLDGDVGTIAVGKRADLLVLDANPLDDIANIRRGRWVVANGRMFECARLWRAAGFDRR